MANLTGTINAQLLLLIVMSVGILIGKVQLIDQRGRNALSDMVIYVLLPCNIVSSFIGIDGWSLLIPLFKMVGISFAGVVVSYLLGVIIFYRTYPGAQKKVLIYSTISSNATFLGNPMVESMYGSIGIVYASMFVLPIRFILYTFGLQLFAGKSDIKKALLHPILVGTYAGLALMLSGWIPPVFIGQALLSIGNCTTALSMLVIGHILSQVKLGNLITKTVVYYSFIRLILLPLALMGVLLIVRSDNITAGVSVALTGMPAPSTGAILADKYGSDSELASKITFVSVVISILSVPALVLLENKFF